MKQSRRINGAQGRWWHSSPGIFGLFLGSFIVVGLMYGLWIRPAAEATELRNRIEAEIRTEAVFIPERTAATILKDYEQQICISLFLWSVLLMGGKFLDLRSEQVEFEWPFEKMQPGERILPSTALDLAKNTLQAAEASGRDADKSLTTRAVLRALRRFHATGSVQETSQAVQELAEAEANRLDSEMAILRYTAWAIPSIGFVGTVRGIGEALMRADQAIQGDVSGVTSALGLAFNSTFVALLLSLFLMLGIYALQRQQEAHVLSAESFCRDRLIENMKVPAL